MNAERLAHTIFNLLNVHVSSDDLMHISQDPSAPRLLHIQAQDKTWFTVEVQQHS